MRFFRSKYVLYGNLGSTWEAGHAHNIWNPPNILNPYYPYSNHPQHSVIASIHHDPIPYDYQIHQTLTTEDPYENLALSLRNVGMYETVISPVIAYMRNKNPMIIFDFCGMINHISDKCTERGPSFHLPIIRQIFYQYNAKNGPTTKVAPVDYKPNLPITQNFHQHTSRPKISEIKCTGPKSTEQKLYLSNILSYLYEYDYYLHAPP